MAKDGQGYKIPENPSPDEMGCILVFYPDDPGYLAALLGAITHMGTWTAWERDPDKRAILAAAAWKEANECTLSSMSCISDLVTVLGEIRDAILSQQISLDAGELVTAVGAVATAIDNQQLTIDPSGLLPALAGIEEAIEGIECGGGMSEEDMAITITQNCGCGCGCGSTTTPPADLELPEDPDAPPVEISEPPVNPSLAQKCSLSHFLIYNLRLSLLRAVEHQGNVNAWNEVWSSLFRVLASGLSVPQIGYEVYRWVMQQLNGNQSVTGWLAATFDPFYDSFVCALYSGADEEECVSNLRSQLSVALGQYPGLLSSAQLLSAHMPLQILFANAGDYEIPGGFGGRACCGEDPDDINPIPLPDDENSVYFLASFRTSELTFTPNNASAALSYNETSGVFTHTPLNGGLNYHEITVAVDENALRSRVGASAIHGAIVQFVDVNDGLGTAKLTGFPKTNAGNIFAVAGRTVMAYDNAEFANVPDYAAYVQQFPNKSNYGNNAIATDMGWRSDTYGTSGQGMGSMRYRIWVVCKD